MIYSKLYIIFLRMHEILYVIWELQLSNRNHPLIVFILISTEMYR